MVDQQFWAPWELRAWTSDDQTALVTPSPIVDITHVELAEGLNAPYQYTIHFSLADPRAVNMTKGMYIELWRGTNPDAPADPYTGSPRELYIRAYIVKSHKMDDSDMEWELICASPSWHLLHKRNLGALIMKHAWGYNDVLDVMNGLPLADGSFPPKHKGVLRPGTNWQFRWVDGLHTPPSSPPGKYNSDGQTWYDTWRGDWNAKYLDALNLGSIYNFGIREARFDPVAPNTARQGWLEGGPLGDDRGFAIWGGRPLLQDLIDNHGYPADAQSANLYIAQQNGYAVIDAVEHQDDMEQIVNLIWCVGKGMPETGGTTLAIYNHGHPVDSDGNPQHGWQLLPSPPLDQYDERIYYRPASRSTYDGHVFSLVAAQQQDDGASDIHTGWAYGVADLTSMGTNGIREDFLPRSDLDDPFLLLAAGLAKLAQKAREVPSFSFTVKHPLLTANNGIPRRPAPGERITINYAGRVLGLDRNQFDFAKTGDLLTYLEFPGTQDPDAANKLSCVTEVHEVWDLEEHSQTITTGWGKKNTKAISEHLARQMVHHNNHPRKGHHSFMHRTIHGLRFVMNGDAWEDESTESLALAPGGVAASEVHWSTFFHDRTGVVFDLDVTDPHAWCDFDFAVPYDHKSGDDLDIALLDPKADQPYGSFRFAFKDPTDASINCGLTSHFYTTQDGSLMTPRGHIESNAFVDDADGRLDTGRYRVHCHFVGGRYELSIQGWDNDPNDTTEAFQTVGVWHDPADDSGNPGTHTIGTWGAIRFRYNGGADTAQVHTLHAHPQWQWQVKRTHLAPGVHHPGWHDIHFWVKDWTPPEGVTPGLATVLLQVHGPVGGFYDHFGRPVKVDNHPEILAQWTANLLITCHAGSMLVWNGAQVNITADDGTLIHPGQFGGVADWQHVKHTHHKVIHIGRVMIKHDRHSLLGVIQGWSQNLLQSHGGAIAPGAVGQRHVNANVHTRFSLHNLSVHVKKGSSRDSHHRDRHACTAIVSLVHTRNGETGTIRSHEGRVIGTMSNSQRQVVLTNFNPGHLLIYNPRVDPDGWPLPGGKVLTGPKSATDPSPPPDPTIIEVAEGGEINGAPFDDETNAHIQVLGKLSDHPDHGSHDYYFHHWNPTGHKKPGTKTAPGSHGKGGDHHTKPGKKHRKKKPGTPPSHHGGGVVHHKPLSGPGN